LIVKAARATTHILTEAQSPISNLLDRSSRLAADSKSRTLQDIQDTIQAIRIVDTSKGQIPAGGGGSAATVSQASANWIEEYFERKCAEMQSRVETYRRMVEARKTCFFVDSGHLLTFFFSRVCAFLQQVSNQLAHSDPDQIKAIVPTIESQHNFALSLAARIAALHSDVSEIKLQYRILLKDRHGISRDPFQAREREGAVVRGLEGVQLR
jgi:nucleoporin p58/p45